MALVPVKDYAEWRMLSTGDVPREQVDKEYHQASVPR